MSPKTTELGPYTPWAVHCLRAYAAYMVLVSVLPGTDPADSSEAFSSAVGLAIWSMVARRYPRGGQLLTLFVIFTRGVASLVQLASGQGPREPATFAMLVMTALAIAVLVMLRSARRQLALAAVGTFALAILYGCFDVVVNQDARQARRAAYRDGATALRKVVADASASDALRTLTVTLPKVEGLGTEARPSKPLVLGFDGSTVSWNGVKLDAPEQLHGKLLGLLPPDPIHLAIDRDTPVDLVRPLGKVLRGHPLRALVDGGAEPLVGVPPESLQPFASGYAKATTDEARTQLLHAELARITVRCPGSLFTLAKPITSHAQLADDLLAALEHCPVGAVDLAQLRFVLLTPLHPHVATPREIPLDGAKLEAPAESIEALWRSARAP